MRRETRDIFSTFMNQAWRIISGPAILLLIPLYLSMEEQGCWYTFTSLAALSVFADLGFGAIVLQFAAHEFTCLRFMTNGFIGGPQEQISRLASFFRFAVRWGVRAILVVFPLISIGGYFFLLRQLQSSSVGWQLGWLLYSCSSGIIFFNNILLTFFEGCNSVARLQEIRLRMAVVTSLTMIGCLLAGAGLYALVFSGMISAGSSTFFLYRYFRKAMYQLWRRSLFHRYNWWPEFSSLMWRYALSWCSGYFGLSAYTPIAFYFWGAETAGKVGLSIAMWTAGFGIANCWMTAVVPRLNMLIEEKSWDQLDRLFQKSFWRTIATMVAGGGGFLAVYAVTREMIPIWKRILSPNGMMILFLCWLGQLVIGNWATYLRAHKKEPLVVYSIISSVYVFIVTLVCTQVFPADYMFLGFLSVMVWGIPYIWRIYDRQKKAHV